MICNRFLLMIRGQVLPIFQFAEFRRTTCTRRKRHSGIWPGQLAGIQRVIWSHRVAVREEIFRHALMKIRANFAVGALFEMPRSGIVINRAADVLIVREV